MSIKTQSACYELVCELCSWHGFVYYENNVSQSKFPGWHFWTPPFSEPAGYSENPPEYMLICEGCTIAIKTAVESREKVKIALSQTIDQSPKERP